jgi:thymidylate kinase
MAATRHNQALIVLTGPVGAGKSTTALAIAERLRSQGVGTASIDLDQIYCMARQRTGFDDEEVWKVARHGAAALSDVFFSTVADVVIVEGGFYNADEISALADHVATNVRLDVFTLRVSFERALERVAADPDPGRVASRNPEVLKWLHDQFVTALPYLNLHSTVIEADLESIDDVAAQIAELIFRQRNSCNA